mgnify:FL=1
MEELRKQNSTSEVLQENQTSGIDNKHDVDDLENQVS